MGVARVGSARALPGVAGAFPATERQDRTTAMNAREAARRRRRFLRKALTIKYIWRLGSNLVVEKSRF